MRERGRGGFAIFFALPDPPSTRALSGLTYPAAGVTAAKLVITPVVMMAKAISNITNSISGMAMPARCVSLFLIFQRKA